jgi:hypothetical protein
LPEREARIRANEFSLHFLLVCVRGNFNDS